ncbi:glycosyltransferase [Streptomyces sp. XD-27]|uniref:glycosyltransferase n=1 Tax=Streptomyces sp. XD-27 TaxID=3062779 RepID=UPI0026F43EC0|nr:glycosyltransferase [Streptomyces sp. XD-27]WKX74291.1 glycosyltransferase [Streptomyces sp. XD-27]
MRWPGRRPRRIAMLSVHTSPLHQPGTGDAGGMNVYIVELAKRLAALNIEVEVFTRATTGTLPPAVELAPGVLVRHIDAGPYEGLAKEELPAQLCAFTHGVMRAWAGHRPGYYDLVHSHYWLSGHVGWLAAERWGVPLVHAMHTMAKVKNAALAEGDTPEPAARVIGETQIVRAADRLVANTDEEGDELIRHYDADRGKVAVVHPGVNLDRFSPYGPEVPGRRHGADGADTGLADAIRTHGTYGTDRTDGTDRADAIRAATGRTGIRRITAADITASRIAAGRAAARARLGLPVDALIPLFAGRIQPLKAPDVLLRAVAIMLDEEPALRSRLVVPVVGGPSGTGLAQPERLQKLAARLGISDVVRFRPPVGQDQLADWYRAASVLVMPSHSESFGLVAIEAQACGTPVVAAAVGGLPVAVRDGVSGFLVDGHDPADYARVLRRFAAGPAGAELVDRMGAAAALHAQSFGWDTAAAATADVYQAAMHERRRLRSAHAHG